MKIALMAPFAMAPKGTTSARVLPIARALAGAGHECMVVIPPYDNPGEAERLEEAGGLGVRWVTAHAARRLPVAGQVAEQAVMARRAVALIRRWDPDLVHVFKPKAVSGLVQLEFWFRPTRAALVLDCDDWEGRRGWSRLERYPAALKWLFDIQERLSLTRNDGVTVASRELELRQLALGGPAARVPNFHDPIRHRAWGDEELRPAGRRALGLDETDVLGIIFTRFFEYPVEGYARLIESFLSAAPRARVAIIGAGKYGQHQQLRRALDDRGVGGRVTHRGWIEAGELGRALAAADVALMPSEDSVAARAKCPARLLDLVVAGVPVAAHDVGEARTYVLDGENGRLVPGSDPVALALAAAGLISVASARWSARETAKRLLAGPLSAATAAQTLEAFYKDSRMRRARRR